jgi:GLPGLI family protein
MKKTLTSLLLLMLVTVGYAQEKELVVDYHFSSIQDPNQKSLQLRANSQKSLSTIHRSNMMKNKEGLVYENKKVSFIYRDYQTNTMISKDDVWKSYVFVKEELPKLNWTTGENQQEILGYKCHEMKTTFRERNYKVWFTTDLPFKAAPWKFHGLPGVVLKVESDGEGLKMEAHALKIQEATPIENPYPNEKYLSWEEYVILYKENQKKFHDFLRRQVAKHGTGGSDDGLQISEPRIEIIVEENRLVKGSKIK